MLSDVSRDGHCDSLLGHANAGIHGKMSCFPDENTQPQVPQNIAENSKNVYSLQHRGIIFDWPYLANTERNGNMTFRCAYIVIQYSFNPIKTSQEAVFCVSRNSKLWESKA